MESGSISLLATGYWLLMDLARSSVRPRRRPRPRPRNRKKYNGIEDHDEDETKNELNPHPATLI
jgi:hypothetical protein